jgi:CHAD domain-containing protein
MAFHLKSGEDVGEGFERILREQFARMERDAGAPDAVHAVRKRCKRVRATLRLLREQNPEFCRAESRVARDLGRSLARLRDAEVLQKTFEKLATDWRGEESLARLRGELPTAGADDVDAALRRVKAISRAARGRLAAAHPGRGVTFGAVESALQGSYRRGRAAMERCRVAGPEEAFHEWRKRVKDLGYQAQIVRRIWPPVLRGWQAELEGLGEILGDDHDLAGLQDVTADRGYDSREWRERLDERMRELRTEALKRGRCLFGEKPGSFRRRLRRYRER